MSRRIVVTELMSLDGVVEDPGGSEGTKHGGWSFKFADPEGFAYKLQELRDHDAMLLGRVTYEGFAAAWPGRTDEEGFADKMNSMPKYVVSSTLEAPEWENSHVISGDLSTEIRKLKESDGGDILIAGSVQLVHALTELDLIDEYRLMMFPVALGSGKRIFGETTEMKPLKLKSQQQLESGTLILEYVA
jgi:dihydrofolate reductase